MALESGQKEIIYRSKDTVQKLLHYTTRTIFAKTSTVKCKSYESLFQLIFKIIFRYQREWRQWTITQPPRAYGYFISPVSDAFSTESMFGFVLYICNGRAQFDVNRIRGESGFTAMCQTSKLSNIDCINDTLYDRAFKLVFGVDATEYNVIATTFTVNGGQYKPLSHCIGSLQTECIKDEMDCIKALVHNWRLGIRYTAVSDIIYGDLVEIQCLPYGQINTSFPSMYSSDKSSLFKNLLRYYQSIYESGRVCISRREFALLLSRSRDRVSIGIGTKIYSILQNNSPSPLNLYALCRSRGVEQEISHDDGELDRMDNFWIELGQIIDDALRGIDINSDTDLAKFTNILLPRGYHVIKIQNDSTSYRSVNNRNTRNEDDSLFITEQA